MQVTKIRRQNRAACYVALSAAAMTAPSSPASAELALSKLVVELPATAKASDVEVFNDSAERVFIVAEPREIIAAGSPQEAPRVSPDPQVLGILVSPRRMVLEPGQRRTLRVARLGSSESHERIYRMTVKPVVGEVSGGGNGLKLLVGYDLLVIARPAIIKTDVSVSRSENEVVMTNRGNSSVELTDGKICAAQAENCRALASKRLYAGASWRLPITSSGRGHYRVRSSTGWADLRF